MIGRKTLERGRLALAPNGARRLAYGYMATTSTPSVPPGN